MEIEPAKLAKMRVIFALRRISPQMQNDVLSGGGAARLGIEVSHPVALPGDVTIDRATLFSFLQKVADGEVLPPEIACADGTTLAVQAKIEGDAVVLSYHKNATRFPAAILLSADAERRRAAGSDLLRMNTLTLANRNAFEQLIGKPEITHEDFFAASSILIASPEAFAAELRGRAESGKLSLSDFLPKHDQYWANLFAARGQSATLAEFISAELGAERRAVFARDPVSGLETASLSFAAPELIPHEIAASVDGDTLLASMKHLLESGDPFALAGAFDVCADRVGNDDRFAGMGDALLGRLFDDTKRLKRELVPYTAAFVVASAHLAQHQVFQREPVFWRRVAAASHAALITRSLGEAPDDNEELVKWAMQIVGKTYYLSVVRDAMDEPRWRPDWIAPRFLAADLYGRVAGAKQRVASGNVPASWTQKIDKATEWLHEERAFLAANFPSIAQGTLPISNQSAPPGTPVADLYDALIREPTAENLIRLTPIVYSFGFEARAREAALEVMQALRTEARPADIEILERVLGLAACIGAQNRDAGLAEVSAHICLERLALAGNDEFVLPAATILVEAAAANTDRTQAVATLAKRLESLAYVSHPTALEELLEILDILRSIDPVLATQLGRARATARLGLSAAPAA